MATYNNVITNVSGSVGIGTTNVTSRLTVLGSTTNLSEPILTVKPGAAQSTATAVLDVQNSAGTSLFFVTGSGNVGVNTTSPVAKLDVVGTAGIRVNEDGIGTKVLTLRSDYASLGPAVNVTTAHPLLFLTNNSERARIDSSGNVGIGTTNPSSKLTVYKANNALGAWNALDLSVNGNSVGDSTYIRWYAADAAVTFARFGVNTAAGAAARFVWDSLYSGGASTTELMTLTATGRLGIGGTNPAARFEVTGSGTSTGATAHFLNSANTSLLIVRDDGNVGIGTSSYTARLYVSGSSTVSTPTMVVREGVASPTGGVATFDVQNSAGASIMLVSGSGYVGIGTTTPTSTLDIHGLQTNTGALSANTPTGTLRLNFNGQPTPGYGASLVFSQRWFSGSPTSYVGVGQITGFKVAGDGGFGGGLSLWYGATGANAMAEGIRLNDAGNVGIGTSSYTARLFVTGSSTVSTPTMIVREGVASPTGGVGILNVQNSAGTSILFVSGSGNVGIGTNTGIEGILTVRGGNSQRLIIQNNGISDNQDYGALTWKNAAGALLGNIALLGNSNSSTSGQTRLALGTRGNDGVSTSLVEILTIQSINSSVGVGTTGPSAKLHTSVTDGNYSFAAGGTTKAFRVTHDSTETRLEGVDNTLSSTFQPLVLGGSTLGFNSNGSTRAMTINTSQNVGIGGTYPLSRLEVTGSGATSATSALHLLNSSNTSLFFVRNDGLVGVGTNAPSNTVHIKTTNPVVRLEASTDSAYLDYNATRLQISAGGGNIQFATGNTLRWLMESTSGYLYPNTDDTGSIGISANRVNSIYARRYINGPSNAGINYKIAYGATTAAAGTTGWRKLATLLVDANDWQSGEIFQIKVRRWYATGGYGNESGTFVINVNGYGSTLATVFPATYTEGFGNGMQFGLQNFTTNGSGATLYYTIDVMFYVTEYLYYNIEYNYAADEFSSVQYPSAVLGVVFNTFYSTTQVAAAGDLVQYTTPSIFTNRTGLVGIGTSSTTSRLLVQGSTSTSTPTMTIKESQAMANAVATLDVQNSAGTSLLFVSGSGAVGIGTNVATINTLNLGASRYILIGDPQLKIGDDGFIQSGTASGDSLISYYQTKSLYIRRFTSSTPVATFDTADNVGIGTTNTNGNKLAITGGNLSLTGSMLPGITTTYNLGSTSYRWNTVHAAYLTGSLTKLQDGSSYIIAGPGISVTTGSAGAITIATSGGGAVTGTGIVNYVAKWDSASNLTTGLIFDNGTNVGIGTTNPQSSLQIGSVAVIGQDVNSAYHGANFTGVGINRIQANYAVMTMYDSASGRISFRRSPYGIAGSAQSWSTSMGIDPNGNVGIGVSGNYPPIVSRFEVTGSGNTSSTSSMNILNGSGTSMLFVRDDGNVGINSSSPVALFNVKGTDTFVGMIAGSTYGAKFVSQAGVGMLIGATDPTGVSSYQPLQLAGTNISIIANANVTGTPTIYANTSQNVGIGQTTTLNARLQVSGSSTASTPTMVVREGVVSPTGGAGVLNVQNSAGSTLFFVSGSGNVGIGTSIPSAKLEIIGVSGSLFSVTDSLSGSLFSVNTISGLPILEVFSDNTLVAGAYNSNALVVTGSRVGVGTNNPTEKLTLSGNMYVVGSAGSSNASAYTSSVFSRIIFNNDYSDSARGPNKITIYDSNWLAGIGVHNATVAYYTGATHAWYKATNTSDAVMRAQIDSNGHLLPGANTTYDLGAPATTWRNLYVTNISGSLTGSNVTAGQVVVAGTGGLLSGSNALWWDNANERVGIGTTIPRHKAHISSVANFSAALKISDGTNFSTGILALGDGNSTTMNVGAWRGLANSMSSPGNWLNLGGYDGIAFTVSNAAIGSQTERMRIDVNGNVGIGTTNANNNRLAISGTASVSGSLLPGDNAATNGYDLGSTTYRWRDVYARSGSYTGDVTISGNLTVAGTQTIVNSDVVNVKDNIILVNAGPSPLSTGGIYVADTVANITGSLIWDTATDVWKAGRAGVETTLVSGSGTTNYVTKWSGANAVGTSVIFDDGTNVGVGTATNLNNKLEVNGVINVATGYRIANAAASGQYLRGNGTNIVLSAIQAGDVPTLNQNTTGNAATATALQTARNLWGQSFNGTADVTGNLSSVGNISGTGTIGINPAASGNIALNTSGAGATIIGGLYYLTSQSVALSVGTDSWVRLATVANLCDLKLIVKINSTNSEECINISIKGNYYNSNTKIDVDRATYAERLREVWVDQPTTNGGNKTIYLRVRSSSFSPTVTWYLYDSTVYPVTVHNDDMTATPPSAGVSVSLSTSINTQQITNANLIVSGTATPKVGIGTNNPTHTLSTNGDVFRYNSITDASNYKGLRVSSSTYSGAEYSTIMALGVGSFQATNIGLVLAPTGSGAITANMPDGTTIGGNARGQYAIDFQRVRGAASMVASGDYSFLAGTQSTASGYGSVAIGYYASAIAQSAVSLGENNYVSAQYAFGAGDSNTSSASWATAHGRRNTASGTASFVAGQFSLASGPSSVAIGQYVTGSANNAVAFGSGSIASGISSIAMGDRNFAQAANAVAIGYNNTASSTTAVAIGNGNTASTNLYPVAIGQANTASGVVSVAIGNYNLASGDNAFVTGRGSKGYLWAQRAHGGINFANQGDAQRSVLVASTSTTNAVQTEMFLDGASAAQRAILPASTTWVAEIEVVARASTGTSHAAFKRRCLISRDGSNNTTLVGSVQVMGSDIGSNVGSPPTGWDVAVSADDTNESLKIAVTGAASTNIRWVARIDLVEVGY